MRNQCAVIAAIAGMLSFGHACLRAEEKPKLVSSDRCEAPNLHEYGNVFLAGQPTAQGLAQAKSHGVKTVINLRTAGEIDWDEAAQAKQLGLEYHHLPFKSAEELTDDLLNRARELLKDAKHRPLLLHCGSANRVGAVWLAHRVLDDGVPFDEALTEAKAVGLRTEAYVTRVDEYIRRAKK